MKTTIIIQKDKEIRGDTMGKSPPENGLYRLVAVEQILINKKKIRYRT